MKNPPLVGKSGTPAGELPLKLKVLVIYEDFETGLRARRALDHFVKQFAKDGELEVDFWRCDLLREPALRQQANIEAARTDILFVSAHSAGELPMIESWLQESLACKGAEPRALALSLDPTPKDTAGVNFMMKDLTALAQLAGVEVFVHVAEDDPAPTAKRTLAETTMPLFEESRPQTEWHQFRDWGINE